MKKAKKIEKRAKAKGKQKFTYVCCLLTIMNLFI